MIATPPSVVDTAASAQAASPVFCCICREDQAYSHTIALSSCGHRFCVSCLSSFLTVQLLTSDETLMCCYRLNMTQRPCGRTISEDDAQRLLAPEIWRLYLSRHGFAHADEREGTVDGEDTDISTECACGRRDFIPHTTLTSCGHRFCLPCVSSLVTHSIMDGHTNWMCTFPIGDTLRSSLALPRESHYCGSSIAYQDLQPLLCPYAWAKFQWLTWIKSNPRARIRSFSEFLGSSNLIPAMEGYGLQGSSLVARYAVNRSVTVDSSADSSTPASEDFDVDGVIDQHPVEIRDIETFLCQVCMEAEAIADKVDLRGCGHSFCRRCLGNFFATGIQGGRVDFTCFYHIEGEGPNSSRLCAAPIPSDEIEGLVSPASWTKYARFALFKSSDQARECPFCLTAQVTNATPENPQCVCSTCNQVFCLKHSNAHTPNETCADYEKRQPRLEKRSKVHVKKISKPCPGCERPIERAGGCMHMTCSVCNANFCWLCCKPWTNSYTHFDPFESTGCRYTYKHRIEAFSSESQVIRGIANVVFYTTMVLFGVPGAIVVAICRVLLCKKTTPAIAAMLIHAGGIFTTAFILRTGFVVGVVGSAFFGCLGEFGKILCSRCFRRREAKPMETWLPVATPHT